jgi:hypothetical protein
MQASAADGAADGAAEVARRAEVEAEAEQRVVGGRSMRARAEVKYEE